MKVPAYQAKLLLTLSPTPPSLSSYHFDSYHFDSYHFDSFAININPYKPVSLLSSVLLLHNLIVLEMDARALNLNKPLPSLPPPMGPSENASSGARLPPAPPRRRMGRKERFIFIIFYVVRTSFLFHLHNNPLLCSIAFCIG